MLRKIRIWRVGRFLSPNLSPNRWSSQLPDLVTDLVTDHKFYSRPDEVGPRGLEEQETGDSWLSGAHRLVFRLQVVAEDRPAAPGPPNSPKSVEALDTCFNGPHSSLGADSEVLAPQDGSPRLLGA